jgi:hypothetical protein
MKPLLESTPSELNVSTQQRTDSNGSRVDLAVDFVFVSPLEVVAGGFPFLTAAFLIFVEFRVSNFVEYCVCGGWCVWKCGNVPFWARLKKVSVQFIIL